MDDSLFSTSREICPGLLLRGFYEHNTAIHSIKIFQLIHDVLNLYKKHPMIDLTNEFAQGL